MDGELIASGIDPASVVSAEDIGGGTYNRAIRVRPADGRRLVLKIAPSAPGLTYEHDLLATEAEYYRLVSGPVPSVVGAGPGFLLMTEVPGEPWNRTPGAGPHLRTELGGIVAGLHKVTGEGFGYPQDPLHPTWPAAFTAMVDAVLADAVRYGCASPGRPRRSRTWCGGTSRCWSRSRPRYWSTSTSGTATSSSTAAACPASSTPNAPSGATRLSEDLDTVQRAL